MVWSTGAMTKRARKRCLGYFSRMKSYKVKWELFHKALYIRIPIYEATRIQWKSSQDDSSHIFQFRPFLSLFMGIIKQPGFPIESKGPRFFFLRGLSPVFCDERFHDPSVWFKHQLQGQNAMADFLGDPTCGMVMLSGKFDNPKHCWSHKLEFVIFPFYLSF